jgi:hypothetical protein
MIKSECHHFATINETQDLWYENQRLLIPLKEEATPNIFVTYSPKSNNGYSQHSRLNCQFTGNTEEHAT